VPLVLVSPRVAPGVRSDAAGSIDVHATLLSLAGLAGGGRALGGRDLTLDDTHGDDVAPAAYGMRRYDPKQGPPRFFFAREDARVTGDFDRLLEDDLEALGYAGE